MSEATEDYRLEPEKLKELIEREIAQLEERLKLLKAILVLIEECQGGGGVGREFRSASGRPVARLVERRDSMMLVFAKPIPEGLPYLKYALSTLERFRGEGLVEYSVEKRENGIVSILVTNIDRSVRDDVHAVLEFVANKLRSINEG